MAEAGEDDDLAAAMAMSLEGQPQPPAEPASPAEAAAAALLGNPAAVLQEADSVEVVKKLLRNLVQSPQDSKFRRVRLGNAKISKVLSCPGAEAVLLAAGFQRGDGVLEVPEGLPAAEVVPRAQAALSALGFREPFALAARLRVGAPVRCVCALPGGGFATGAMDNAVRVYRPGQWEQPAVLSGHAQRAGVDGVLAVAPDREDLVSAGRDGKIIFWRGGAQWQQWGELTGHGQGIEGTNTHVVSCLGRRADGALLSGGWDKTVRAWDDGEQVALLPGHTVAVNAVLGLPSGEVVSGSGDQTIGIWRGSARLRSCAASAPVRTLCACGGGLFASAGNDGLVRLWDAATGRQLAECKVASGYVMSLAFSAATGEIAAGADDGTLAVAALRGAQAGSPTLEVLEVLQHCGEVYGVAYLGDGDLVAASGDGTCAVWTRSPARAASPSVQREFAEAARALAAARAPAPASGGANPGSGGSYNMSYPVELGGKKMTLEWNRGERPQAVAERFLAANGLDARHSGDVVAFVMHAEQQSAAGGAAPAASAANGAKDFNFPVEVADGRRLTISWNRGEDPQAVALNFARQHGGIAANELPDIVAFIQQASGGAAASGAPMLAQQAPAPSAAQQQEAMQQVMEMGFDEAVARNALQACGWSVETAVQSLLG